MWEGYSTPSVDVSAKYAKSERKKYQLFLHNELVYVPSSLFPLILHEVTASITCRLYMYTYTYMYQSMGALGARAPP